MWALRLALGGCDEMDWVRRFGLGFPDSPVRHGFVAVVAETETWPSRLRGRGGHDWITMVLAGALDRYAVGRIGPGGYSSVLPRPISPIAAILAMPPLRDGAIPPYRTVLSRPISPIAAISAMLPLRDGTIPSYRSVLPTIPSNPPMIEPVAGASGDTARPSLPSDVGDVVDVAMRITTAPGGETVRRSGAADVAVRITTAPPG